MRLKLTCPRCGTENEDLDNEKVDGFSVRTNENGPKAFAPTDGSVVVVTTVPAYGITPIEP